MPARTAGALALVCLALLLGKNPPQFEDVAAQAGLTDVFYCGTDAAKKYILETLGGGIGLLDYDNDGWLDVFIVSATRFEGFPSGTTASNHLYRNQHDGTFRRVTAEAGLQSAGWGQGVCAGDYDNDGFIDLFVTSWGQNRLYRNTGNGKFADVTEASGLKQGTRWGTGCAFVDYDLDGRLDLFVANYIVFDQQKIPLPGTSPNCRWKGTAVMCGPKGLPGGTNLLFHNEDGKFRDVSESSGVAAVNDRYSMSVTPLDFNHDGWPDIFVAVDSQASILFRNNKDGTFTDVAVAGGVAYSEDGREQAGMGSAAGDYDADGWLDLAKTNFIDDTANVYRNNGDGTFEDAVHATGVGRNMKFMGWGMAFLDYNNDGWPDLIMANGHVYPEIESRVPDSPYRQQRLLYRNELGKKFEDVSAEAGGIAERHSSRGLAVGDYNNDGNVDVFVWNMNEPPSLLRNSGAGGHFLNLRLIGVTANRSAIGARVTVVAAGRKQVQEVRSGSSFLSQSDLRLHFGLGSQAKVDRIEIEWPRVGLRQTVQNVAADRFVTITEAKGVTDVRPPL